MLTETEFGGLAAAMAEYEAVMMERDGPQDTDVRMRRAYAGAERAFDKIKEAWYAR